MIITQTPLRISLAGGGTDFKEFYSREGGCVVSSAIDKYVYVILKERFDRKIYINYTKKEIVDCVDEVEHGLVREAMKKTGIADGVEITTLADVPSEGTGLGSSSSITVGLLNACYLHQGQQKTAEDLAREACEIEIDILGKPIGIQDQYIAAYGSLRHFLFQKDGTVEQQGIRVRDTARRRLESNLLLFFTDQTRRSEAVLSQQRQDTVKNSQILVRMKQLAQATRECLEKEDFDEVGRLLHAGWTEKKKLADNVTNERIDALYDAALKAGALGGKITGAGGGGFLLLYCPPHRQEDVRTVLCHLRELPFHMERDGSKAVLNIRRYDWRS